MLRYLEVAMADTLALDNSVGRNRALIVGVDAAIGISQIESVQITKC